MTDAASTLPDEVPAQGRKREPITSDAGVRNAKVEAKQYKRRVTGTPGLYLVVAPSGTKRWIYRYKLGAGSARESMMGIGAYPRVTLKEAREKASAARDMVRDGLNPALARKQAREQTRVEQETTFEVIARRWLEQQRLTVTPAHALDCQQRLEKHVFPWLGHLPMKGITTPDIAAVLKRINSKSRFHMASRCRTMISQVFRFAIPQGLAQYDPARDVGDVLVSKPVKHLPAFESVHEAVKLLQVVDRSRAQQTTKIATRLLALLALRTIELRGARWEEVDFDAATWTVPAERMKKRRTHTVPLSTQAVALLRELHTITGTGDYLFPGSGPKHPIMSEATINAAIKRAGYEGQHTGHGFRALFSTVLNDAGYRPDVIEYALAHVNGDRVRTAYNRGDYLRDRRDLMQAWADLVSAAENNGSNVIPIRAA